MSRQSITVSIENRDIKQGVPGHGSHCAVSCAIARTLHCGKGNVGVCSDSQVFIGGILYTPKTYNDERKLNRFLDNFDSDSHRRYCRPTTITLKREEKDW